MAAAAAAAQRPFYSSKALLLFLLFLATRRRKFQVQADRRASWPTTHAVRKYLVHRTLTNGLLKSIPALSKQQNTGSIRRIEEASMRPKRAPSFEKIVQRDFSGSFYGLSSEQISTYMDPTKPKRPKTATDGAGLEKKSTGKSSRLLKRGNMQDTLAETLDELRIMRQEMERLRLEMQAIKRGITGEIDDDAILSGPRIDPDSPEAVEARRKRQQEFDEYVFEYWLSACGGLSLCCGI